MTAHSSLAVCVMRGPLNALNHWTGFCDLLRVTDAVRCVEMRSMYVLSEGIQAWPASRCNPDGSVHSPPDTRLTLVAMNTSAQNAVKYAVISNYQIHKCRVMNHL